MADFDIKFGKTIGFDGLPISAPLAFSPGREVQIYVTINDGSNWLTIQEFLTQYGDTYTIGVGKESIFQADIASLPIWESDTASYFDKKLHLLNAGVNIFDINITGDEITRSQNSSLNTIPITTKTKGKRTLSIYIKKGNKVIEQQSRGISVRTGIGDLGLTWPSQENFTINSDTKLNFNLEPALANTSENKKQVYISSVVGLMQEVYDQDTQTLRHVSAAFPITRMFGFGKTLNTETIDRKFNFAVNGFLSIGLTHPGTSEYDASNTIFKNIYYKTNGDTTDASPRLQMHVASGGRKNSELRPFVKMYSIYTDDPFNYIKIGNQLFSDFNSMSSPASTEDWITERINVTIGDSSEQTPAEQSLFFGTGSYKTEGNSPKAYIITVENEVENENFAVDDARLKLIFDEKSLVTNSQGHKNAFVQELERSYRNQNYIRQGYLDGRYYYYIVPVYDYDLIDRVLMNYSLWSPDSSSTKTTEDFVKTMYTYIGGQLIPNFLLEIYTYNTAKSQIIWNQEFTNKEPEEQLLQYELNAKYEGPHAEHFEIRYLLLTANDYVASGNGWELAGLYEFLDSSQSDYLYNFYNWWKYIRYDATMNISSDSGYIRYSNGRLEVTAFNEPNIKIAAYAVKKASHPDYDPERPHFPHKTDNSNIIVIKPIKYPAPLRPKSNKEAINIEWDLIDGTNISPFVSGEEPSSLYGGNRPSTKNLWTIDKKLLGPQIYKVSYLQKVKGQGSQGSTVLTFDPLKTGASDLTFMVNKFGINPARTNPATMFKRPKSTQVEYEPDGYSTQLTHYHAHHSFNTLGFLARGIEDSSKLPIIELPNGNIRFGYSADWIYSYNGFSLNNNAEERLGGKPWGVLLNCTSDFINLPIKHQRGAIHRNEDNKNYSSSLITYELENSFEKFNFETPKITDQSGASIPIFANKISNRLQGKFSAQVESNSDLIDFVITNGMNQNFQYWDDLQNDQSPANSRTTDFIHSPLKETNDTSNYIYMYAKWNGGQAIQQNIDHKDVNPTSASITFSVDENDKYLGGSITKTINIPVCYRVQIQPLFIIHFLMSGSPVTMVFSSSFFGLNKLNTAAPTMVESMIFTSFLDGGILKGDKPRAKINKTDGQGSHAGRQIFDELSSQEIIGDSLAARNVFNYASRYDLNLITGDSAGSQWTSKNAFHAFHRLEDIKNINTENYEKNTIGVSVLPDNFGSIAYYEKGKNVNIDAPRSVYCPLGVYTQYDQLKIIPESIDSHLSGNSKYLDQYGLPFAFKGWLSSSSSDLITTPDNDAYGEGWEDLKNTLKQSSIQGNFANVFPMHQSYSLFNDSRNVKPIGLNDFENDYWRASHFYTMGSNEYNNPNLQFSIYEDDPLSVTLVPLYELDLI
jgi:hypothetical protein